MNQNHVDQSELPLRLVQRLRKAAIGVALTTAVVALACSDSAWRVDAPWLYDTIEWAGVFLIIVCICGRTWCTLYIGSRKKTELTTVGPYSIVRNPLYVFTLIGTIGIGAQFASFTAAAVMAAITALIFRAVVTREETYLSATFGDQWTSYSNRVPRFWPSLSLWSDRETLVIKPALVTRTFFDATLFALSIPAADMIELGQAHGLLPVLVLLH